MLIKQAIKLICFGIILQLGWSSCTIQKRKYFNGWYFSKKHAKANQELIPQNFILQLPYENMLIRDSLRPANLTCEKKCNKVLDSNYPYLREQNNKVSNKIDSTKWGAFKRIYKKSNFLKEIKKSQREKTSVAQPLLPLLLFLIGIISLGLSVVFLANYGITFYLLLLSMSGILFFLTYWISNNNVQILKKNNLKGKTRLYNALAIFSIVLGIICCLGLIVLFGPPI